MGNQTGVATAARSEPSFWRGADYSDAIIEGSKGTRSAECVADELLRAVGIIGRRNPGVYTEVQLARKIRDEHSRLPMLDELALPVDVVNYLVERWIDELIEVSRLSLRQEVVLRMSLCGLSSKDIAEALNRRRQSVSVMLRVARRKMQAAYADGRYAGWHEVYLNEVRRPAYRRRRG